MQEKISFKNSNNKEILMSAIINFPNNFDKTKKYSAIVVTHPGGGVKEQTAGLYSKKIAESGFITIAYDATYQGESGGFPRQLENPYIRTEDVSAVIDHLLTLSFIDQQKIGALGICAGGGYTANAAINDHRIKAVGTVSAVNIGQMFRNGWDNNIKNEDAIGYLLFGADARTKDITEKENVSMPMAPLKETDAPNEELRQAWEYYHTDRCKWMTAPGFATARSLTQLMTYDAYGFSESYFTQPLLMIAGSKAGSKWMSDDLMKRAKTENKKLHVVEGANHMSLYDIEKYVEEAVTELKTFFKNNL